MADRMHAAPLVSIVIPAYNHAGYLDEAIGSVLNQDYPRVELLVLNDGSTDGTPAVLEKYGRSFYWETQPNMGQAATLNKGWRRPNSSLENLRGCGRPWMSSVGSPLQMLSRILEAKRSRGSAKH